MEERERENEKARVILFVYILTNSIPSSFIEFIIIIIIIVLVVIIIFQLSAKTKARYSK